MFWYPLCIDHALYEDSQVGLYSAYHADLMGSPELTSSPLDLIPVQKGNLLDIGCANGTFLQYARSKGFRVYGVDFDSQSIKHARKRGLKNLYAMSFDEFYHYAQQISLRFAVITFFDVLEHQENPSRFIQHVKDLLNEDGFIIGKVPNRDRFLQCMRSELDYDFPPHHLLMWSEKAVRNFLRMHRFSEIQVHITPFNFQRFLWHLEKKVIGKWLPIRIKSTIFRLDPKISHVPTETLERYTGKKGTGIRALKRIEDSLFSFAALPLYPFFKTKGLHITFSARNGSHGS
jgi:2-polyprenyl-3-methyl-5-hydroxy-6-metoxy-1,4-benzoquinol methylase